ncbi:family 43 glycosylhydrolase [Butyrivibrio sp. INlla16]|uniref:family 43 glycosylhydrolase n=1 Tax=Butyrivibrio sp. INlla16 TaxID=1520807 RepID=UPI00088DE628|nr:family 43 glycosylhydrolase [Butyrivibrio sp. INlla16]SDB08558.1 Glycosyl hydrolases family 43 [Butyrivibrio sp. INlla16]
MKKILCNPINIDYHYQFIKDGMSGEQHISREAADPTFLFYKGKYYIFASMNMSVWVSDDLINWKSVRLPDNLPLLDYAPDVRVIGDYVYFSASKRGEICNFYRTRDIENGPYEEIEGTFDFWDPNLFQDDDGRVYFYWGCSNMTPIWGVELDTETMKPLSERIELINGRPKELGYERCGENHSKRLIEGEELDRVFEGFKKNMGEEAFSKASDTDKAFFRSMLSNNPFIEGAYMNKHDGKYYLQYAATGAEYNVYNDGVYVSDSPLGPFELAKNNPYSYQPGGFMPGAGHGSTMEDKNGNFWHTSTMRISLNDPMERRVGIWPAGFDNDGELFCNTGYGDWPRSINDGKPDPWAEPEWFLLSRNAKMSASSVSKEDTVSPVGDNNPERACEEDTRTWWRAADNKPGEWLLMDMREVKDVRFIQINFADDSIEALPPGEIPENGFGARLIDERKYVTRYVLEGSSDGENYEILSDKSKADTNLPHDTLLIENGKRLRFIKLTILELPMNQKAAVSGIRVFGKGNGRAPGEVTFTATIESELDMSITMSSEGADGYNIKWGHAENKLYHSCMYYPEKGSSKGTRSIGALIKGQEVYLQVDAFNENGITHGEVQRLR